MQPIRQKNGLFVPATKSLASREEEKQGGSFPPSFHSIMSAACYQRSDSASNLDDSNPGAQEPKFAQKQSKEKGRALVLSRSPFIQLSMTDRFVDKENKNTRKLPGDDVNSVIISCLATWFVLCSKGNGMQRKTVHVALT